MIYRRRSGRASADDQQLGQRLEGHPRSAGDDMAFKTKRMKWLSNPKVLTCIYFGAVNRRWVGIWIHHFDA
jgi:hypothetical protein